MKIAVVFTGISYGHGRDFNHCYSNIQETIISPLRDKNDVSVFLYTYENDLIKELVKLYNPTDYKTLPFEKSHQVGTYIKSMENLRGYDFDFVIATRFDIHFHKEINFINIDFLKFNVLFPEKDWNNKIKWWPIWRKVKYVNKIRIPFLAKFSTDNFFAFPYSMLDDFISALQEEYKKPTRRGLMDMHSVFHRVEKKVGKDKVHLISLEPEKSDVNSFYSLCRTK